MILCQQWILLELLNRTCQEPRATQVNVASLPSFSGFERVVHCLSIEDGFQPHAVDFSLPFLSLALNQAGAAC